MEIQSAFEQAIAAIDTGDLKTLELLIDADPGLLTHRYHTPDNGYFKYPYLLWFVADNPIRHETMPANIVGLTAMMIRKAKELHIPGLGDQLNYTLALVVSGRIPREQGVQIPLAELLIDAGAKPGGTVGALAHRNMDVARFLVEKGEQVELITAVCLDMPFAEQMAMNATQEQRLEALIGAAFFGKTAAIRMLISLGTDVNGYAQSKGFHTHGTALHQAISSASFESVKLLVDAGANAGLKDKIYQATPLGWAEYGMSGEETSGEQKKNLQKIVELLRSIG